MQFGQEVTDDRAALARLAQAYQQAQQLAPLAPRVQEYLTHAEAFSQWRRQQEEAERARQEQAKQWWKPPEYDPTWESKIVRDPVTNELRPAPGAPPDVVQRYLRFKEHERSFMTKFATDPIGAIKPGIEQLVAEQAQKIVQQEVARVQQQMQAQQLVEQNASWLFAFDTEGRRLTDGNGQPRLSAWGQRYAAYAQAAVQMGITDLARQHEYAAGMVRAEAAQQLLTQQQAGQQGQQQAAALQQPATPAGGRRETPPNQVAALRGNRGTGASTDEQPLGGQNGKSLRERMHAEFRRAGIKDGEMIGRQAG